MSLYQKYIKSEAYKAYNYTMWFLKTYHMGWTMERGILARSLRRYKEKENYIQVVRLLIKKEFPEILYDQRTIWQRIKEELLHIK